MTDSVEILEPIKPPESGRLVRALRDETTGGLILIAISVVALLWANSAWASSYESLVALKFGPESLDLHLSVSQWASEFLLAFFFFVIGTELKHEIVHGSLAQVRQAVVPIVGAISGMIFAAGIFLIFNAGTENQSAWGIPISTDVAFALAILAIAGKTLPLELRSFLLTVAVVNDLCAIVVIAIFYGHGFHFESFLVAMSCIGVFALLQHFGLTSFWLGFPLALLAWYSMLGSGIHATIAGVALGLAMSVNRSSEDSESPAEKAERFVRPISAGLCVPAFALVSIGITFNSSSAIDLLSDPITLGILGGLVVGQPLGVTLGAYLTARLTKGNLNSALTWSDVAVVGTLASIGFTVALLITEVSFGTNEGALNTAKFGIITTNVVAMIVATCAIRLRKSRKP